MPNPTTRGSLSAAPHTVEQLDQLMQVTSPRAWIALLALGLVLLTALLWGWFGTVTTTIEGQGVLMRQGGVLSLKSPDAGFVTHIVVASGERVEKGQELLRLAPAVSGAAEVKVVAPVTALVLRRVAREGDKVARDDVLLTLEPQDEPLQVRLFLPVSEGYQVRKGQAVQVLPALARKGESGYLLGHVVSAARFPITPEEMLRRVQNEELVRQLTREGPCLQIIVELEADPASASGYKWSSPRGQKLSLFSGTPCQAHVIVRQQRPLRLVFPDLEAEGD